MYSKAVKKSRHCKAGHAADFRKPCPKYMITAEPIRILPWFLIFQTAGTSAHSPAGLFRRLIRRTGLGDAAQNGLIMFDRGRVFRI